jgi:hypothetical protein
VNVREKNLLLKAAGALLGLSALITSSGCATVTQTEIKMLETRELDLPYDAAYNAALNAMFSMGLSIQHTDKASGVISGQSGDHVQRASVGAIWRPLYPVKKVTLMLSALEPGVTQLRMKMLINEQPQYDRTLMTKIWQQIEREAMLESRPSDRLPSTRPSTTAPTGG